MHTCRRRAYPIPLQTVKAQLLKIRRRARSAMESNRKMSLQVPSRDTPSLTRTTHPPINISLTDFKTSASEKKSVESLSQDLYTYLWLKLNLDSNDSINTFVSVQDYFILTKPKEKEKSNIVYFDVLDAIADKKETVLLVLDKLKKQIIEGQGKQWLVVPGDAKLYKV